MSMRTPARWCLASLPGTARKLHHIVVWVLQKLPLGLVKISLLFGNVLSGHIRTYGLSGWVLDKLLTAVSSGG